MGTIKNVFRVVLLGSLLLVAVAWAANTHEPAPGAPLPNDETRISPRPLSPMMTDILAAQQESQTEISLLQARLKAAGGENQALSILEEINTCKQAMEIEILRIQERYARQAGHTETADKIKEAIEKTLNPDPVTPTAEAQAERQARREAANGSGGSGNE